MIYQPLEYPWVWRLESYGFAATLQCMLTLWDVYSWLEVDVWNVQEWK